MGKDLMRISPQALGALRRATSRPPAAPNTAIHRRSQLALGVVLVARCMHVIRHTGGRPVTIYPDERFKIVAQEYDGDRWWIRIVREDSRRRVNGWAVPVSGAPHLFKLAKPGKQQTA